jgi:hypothetical protein
MFPGEGNGTSAVNSVNGEQGDVIITAEDVNAQPMSTILTDIAAITMPNNSLLMVDNSGEFTATSCMPAAVAWLSYTTVDQQKDHLALAEVASSGDYNDLVNKPASVSVPTKTSDLTNDSGFITAGAIPAQVNSDWNSTSGKSQILNKPILFSGSYADLTGKPTLFSGSYSDLTNKPTIPSVNYPVTSVNAKVGAVVLTNADVGAAASVHTHTISDITGLQSSLDSKASTASLSGYATTGALATATTGLRKVETFLGTTDASGNLTITFANTYTTPPDIQPQIIGGTFNQSVRVVSVSNSGCVLQAAQRNLVTLLSIEVLLGATVNLVGASVTVQVTPRT